MIELGQISYADFTSALHHQSNVDQKSSGLGVPVLDGYNRELVSILWALPMMPDGIFSMLFTEMVKHTREHFSQEELLMRETGFSNSYDHHDEHKNILNELDRLLVMVKSGRMNLPREYVRNVLPEWYAIHHATLDATLATHLKSALFLNQPEL